MTINEFLQKYRKQRNGMQIVRPRVRCADGYTVSVQAGDRWNSEPQLDTGSRRCGQWNLLSRSARCLERTKK